MNLFKKNLKLNKTICKLKKKRFSQINSPKLIILFNKIY